ncbi:MAG: hypothetical protein Q9219_006232 [cf. Caloplaca sp. 3 TL-2023]
MSILRRDIGLQLTAQAEYQLVTSSTGLSSIIPRLESAIQEAAVHPEDVFQARICLGWLHWALNDSESALQSLPRDVSKAFNDLARVEGEKLNWSSICAIRGACIQGDLQEKTGDIDEALRTYKSILPHIEKTLSAGFSVPEYFACSERLLAQYCFLSNETFTKATTRRKDIRSLSPILAPFRSWADLSTRSPKLKSAGVNQLSKAQPVPHRRIWQLYYDTLSIILHNGLPFPAAPQRPSTSTTEMTTDNVKSLENPRLLQSIELRRVEGIYEDLLMRELSFPKANEANVEVESWADQVVSNWEVMSSLSWLNEDLGKGGKELLTRNTLAVLYRAATRTFHSTRILRHLFTVHTALADFDLAAKAFDTYIELVKKGKARSEKSGETEVGLDDDAAVFRTAAAGIQMLCIYGRRKQHERAQEVAALLEDWLEQFQSLSEPMTNANDTPADLKNQYRHPRRSIPGEAFAVAYRSLGICRASWARLTYETSSRPELHAKAVASFRLALKYASTSLQRAETQYALALILGETRDVDGAIDAAKRAISFAIQDDVKSEEMGSFSDLSEVLVRRLLFKAWHLLALLLSARHEFDTAIVACEAAWELYADLFEGLEQHTMTEKLALPEKEGIIELKISQVVLSEILDGPEEAVNACGDVFSLYKQLFTYDEASAVHTPAVAISSPNGTASLSTTANGTVRSVRRSLLGRSKNVVGSLPRIGHHSNHIPVAGAIPPELPGNMDSSSLQDGSIIEKTYQPPHHLGRQESKKLQKRNSRKSIVSNQNRGSSPKKSSLADGSEELVQGLPLRASQLKRRSVETSHGGPTTEDRKQDMGAAVKSSVSPDQQPSSSPQEESVAPLPTTSYITHSTDQNSASGFIKPPLSGSSNAPPIPSRSLLALPDPIFPSADLNRRSLSLLTRIWLLIAQLYRDGGMPNDAQGALSEACRQAKSIEAAVLAREASAETLSLPGWGGVKSAAEVWADVLAEQAALHLQLGNTDAASEAYEKALGWFPDHNAATVGLSRILLDYYDQVEVDAKPTESSVKSPTPKPTLASFPTSKGWAGRTGQGDKQNVDASPVLLSRLAARDRAYGLLSMLTKSGRGWDDSEAWTALAKVHEQSGQIEKAKEALWWVVELEDSRPLREWDCIGGF